MLSGYLSVLEVCCLALSQNTCTLNIQIMSLGLKCFKYFKLALNIGFCFIPKNTLFLYNLHEMHVFIT